MDPFVTHRGRIAVLDWSDVNTDLIIPARYLKRIERTGYGPLLFADRRYAPGGAPPIDDPEAHGPDAADFPLNHPELKGASILVVGRNFGCGSSREHAVWAIAELDHPRHDNLKGREEAWGSAVDIAPRAGYPWPDTWPLNCLEIS